MAFLLAEVGMISVMLSISLAEMKFCSSLPKYCNNGISVGGSCESYGINEYHRVGPHVEDFSHVGIELFTFGDVVSQPVISLEIHILDEQRVKSVNISDEQIPISLQLRLHLGQCKDLSLLTSMALKEFA